MAKLKLTEQQQAAVENRGGSLLVSAAAGSGNAHYGADNHANDPHERSQNADQDKILCIQLLIHGCSS